MDPGMIRSFDGDLYQTEKIVANRDNRQTFDCSLYFDLGLGSFSHRLNLSGVLDLDFHLDTGLEQIDQMHGGM